MPYSLEIALLFVVQLAVAIIVMRRTLDGRRDTVGLPLAFILLLLVVHCGALVYINPHYRHERDPYLRAMGFSAATVVVGSRAASIASVGFVVGLFLADRRGRRLAFFRQRTLRTSPSRLSVHSSAPLEQRAVPAPTAAPLASQHLAISLALLGAFSFVCSAVLPPITSLQPVIAAGRSAMLTAICVGLYDAQKRQAFSRIIQWLFVASLLPAIWLLGFGFLSYAAISLLVFGAFWASQSRRLRGNMTRLGLLLLVISYGGLSVFVIYMEHRDQLRKVVWGGRPFSERISVAISAASQITPFDPLNESHLHIINTRLNQSVLYGLAARYLDRHPRLAPNGETFLVAALAWVPRLAWADKPAVGGSYSFVKYTGCRVSKGTTVSGGLIFECLINFGMLGVLLGFILYGYVFQMVDKKCAQLLQADELIAFVRTFLVGVTLVEVTSFLYGIVSEIAAMLVIGFLISRFYSGFPREDTPAVRLVR